MRLIRSEKLNSVLPYVMRDNEVDMWIHAMGPNDPLGFELGTESGFVVFTDRDGGQIERAAFGGRRDPELFDVMGAVDEIADLRRGTRSRPHRLELLRYSRTRHNYG